MSRQNIIIAAVVVVAIVLVVWIVSPGREERAKAQLDTIYKIEQAGNFDQAINQYETLIKEYDGTQAARLAVDYIERVNRYKERLQIQEVRRNLERIALVLNGYREMLGQMPASIEQLDGGDYMFDSDYVAEIVPEGYTYYLRFDPAVSSYTIFSFNAATEKAVRYNADGKAAAISKDELEKETGQQELKRIEKGQMVFLQPSA